MRRTGAPSLVNITASVQNTPESPRSGKRAADLDISADVVDSPKQPALSGADADVASLLSRCGVTMSGGRFHFADEAPNCRRILQQRDLGLRGDELTKFITTCEAAVLRAAVGPSGDTDSLLHVLLSCEKFQQEVVTYALDKLVAISVGGSHTPDLTEEETSQLILAALRWLPPPTDGRWFANKIIQVLGLLSFDLKREVIQRLPELLDDGEHEKVSEALENLLFADSKLLPAILDTLTQFSLSVSRRDQLNSAALGCLPSIAPQDIPVALQFLLSGVEKTDQGRKMLLQVRCSLTLEEGDADWKLACGEVLRTCLLLQPHLALVWVKVMQTGNLVSLDVAALLTLFSINWRPKTLISLVNTTDFTDAVISRFFAQLGCIVPSMLSSVLSLCEQLIEQPSKSQFAITVYRNSFKHFNASAAQEVVASLVSVVCRAPVALRCLSLLAGDDLDRLATFSLIVKGLLDYADRLPPTQVRQLYTLLARLSSRPAGAGVAAELTILVKKQLASSSQQLSSLGILGAVLLTAESDAPEADSAGSSSGGQLPQLLPLVWNSAKTAAAKTLLFDELALQLPRLHESTVMWLYKNVQELFQSLFQCELTREALDTPPNVANMQTEWLFGDDWPEDSQDEKIAGIDIISAIAMVSDRSLLLPSALRLLLGAQFILDEKLSLSPLLTCPLRLPRLAYLDEAGALSGTQLDLLASSLLTAINTCRELVDVFSRVEDFREKVCERLSTLGELCEHFIHAVSSHPSWLSERRTGSAAKRSAPSTTKTQVEPLPSTAGVETQSATTETKLRGRQARAKPVTTADVIFLYREWSLAPLELLTSSLPLPPAAAELLLQDLHLKVLYVFEEKKNTFGRAVHRQCTAQLDAIPEDKFLLWCAEAVPTLVRLVDSSAVFFRHILSESDSIMSTQLRHSTEVAVQRHLFTCSLDIVSTILLSAVLKRSSPRVRMKIVKSLHETLSHADEPAPTQTQLSQTRHGQIVERFTMLLPCCPNLATVSSLVRCAQALVVCTNMSSVGKQAIHQLSLQVLQSDWAGLHGSELTRLVNTYLEMSPDPLHTISQLLSGPVSQICEEDCETSGQMKTLTHATFSVFYTAMMQALNNTVKKFDYSDEMVCLEQWTIAIQEFHTLCDLVKAFEQKQNLAIVLKFGDAFIQLFLRHAMPLMEKLFTSHVTEIVAALKELQQGTRGLHNISGHGKILADATLMRHIPSLKKSLETLVFRVKTMLAKNNCIEAFWIGNLKQRNLQGEEIMSQEAEDAATSGDDTGNAPEEEQDAGGSNKSGSDVELLSDSESGPSEEITASGEYDAEDSPSL